MFLNLLADISAGTIADIVILVLTLIVVGINMKKGFVKQIIGLVATLAALFLAYLLCSSVAELLNNQFGWHDKLAESILKGLTDKNSFDFSQIATDETVKSGVLALGLPGFMSDAVLKLFAETSGSAVTVGQMISDVLAKYILLGASFLVIFIVARLLLQLVKALIIKLVSLPILKGFDKLLALALGLIKVIILIYIVVYVVNLMPNVAAFVDAIKTAVADSQIIKFLNATGVVEWFLKIFSDLLSSIKF